MKAWIQSRSFLWKIMVLNTLLLIVTFAVNSFQFKKVVNVIKQRQEEFLLDSAENISEAVATQFFERYGDVLTAAANPLVETGSLNERRETLNELVALNPIYDLMMIVDTNGKVLATNTKSSTGKTLKPGDLDKFNAQEENWFKNVSTGKFTEDKEKGFSGAVFQDPSYSPLLASMYEEKRYVSVFSAPIKNKGGKTIGYPPSRPIISCNSSSKSPVTLS